MMGGFMGGGAGGGEEESGENLLGMDEAALEKVLADPLLLLFLSVRP